MSDAPLPAGAGGDAASETPAPTRRSRLWRSVRRHRLRTGAIALVAIVALLAATVTGYSIYRNNQIQHIAVGHLSKTAANGVENILLIGSTSRCALKTQNPAFGTCAGGVTGVNSDVIMVLHLDPKHRHVALLSFPRDTFVPNARPRETNRIDSALLYGPTQLVSVIEDDFGIPINHFVELNFDSFQGVVNALGGISMYFPDPVKDAYSSLNIKRTGCVHLNGFQALAVVRARHMQYELDGKWYYDGSGDLGRIERDHEFLQVLAGALAKKSLGNPLTDNALFGAIAPQLEVDDGFGLHDIVNLVLTYHTVNANNAPQFTLPVRVDPSSTYLYKGANYGYVVFPSEPQDQQIINKFLKGSTTTHRPPANDVSVFVEGGVGSPAQTATVANKLRSDGFVVKGTSEVPSTGPISETDVLYVPGQLLAGERVLGSLSGVVALGKQVSSNGAEVTVVVGSDVSVRTKAPKPTTQGTASTKSATTPSAASASLANGPASGTLLAAISNVLTPPTVAHQALASYDPRACPPRKHHKKATKTPKT